MPLTYIFNEKMQMFEIEIPKPFNRDTVISNTIENRFKNSQNKKTLLDKILHFFIRCK